MLAIIAALLFGFAWLIHGAHASMPVWFNADGMALAGLVLLALHLVWPGYPWRRT
jgi:hypothetical protein